MARIVHGSNTIDIDCPPEQVFDFVANFENDAQWRSEVKEMRFLEPGGVRLGQKNRERAAVWGQTMVTVTVITELQPGRKVKVETESGPVPVTVVRTCEPVNGGTRFTYTMDGDLTAKPLFRIFSFILVPYYRRQLAGYLQKLKEIMERR